MVDPNLLSKQEKGEIDNTLSIKATTDLVVTEKESTAKKTVNNTWVKKEAIATYDYSENSLKWKITANPNHLPISELVIEDLLPVGLELPKEIKIKSIPKSGDVTETTINPKIKTEDEFTYTETNGQEGIYPKNSFSLSKGAETTDTIEIEFSTEVNASFRKEQFKNDIKVKFENNINLTGLYADKEAFKVNASANAVHNPLIDPLTKSGIYQNNEYEIDGVKVKIPHITWQIVLNRAQVDMSGWTLVDRLKPFLELDPFSVKLYEVELNADGTMILENKSEVANGLFIMDSGGFSFNVPESLKGKVLMIEFVTLVTDTASAKEMSNQAILVMDEENSTSTKEVIASGAQDFNFEDFATASTVPVVKVWKISENSELDKDDKPLYPIYGAEFQLTPLELKDGDWKPSEGSIKAKTTTQTGAATFMFLKKNQLYEIREIEAPNGYELNEDPKYIVFNPEEEQAFPKGTVEKNDKELFHTFMIKNQPVDASTIEFYVRMSDGTPISGIEYEIKSKNTKARKATSDMNGKVIFANVDQDEYTITLVKGLGFDLSETIKAKVDEKGIIITNGTIIINDKDVVVASADFYGTVTVNKTNNNTEPLSSAEFIVYTMQNVAVASLKESGVSGTYQLSNEKDDETLYNVANKDGQSYLKEDHSEFQLLGGNYYIWESVAPLGYKVDKIKHPIFITETNRMIELTISNQKVIEPINPDDSGSTGGGSPSKPKPVYPDIEEIVPDLPIEEIQHPTNPMNPVGETSSSSNAGTNTYDTPNTGILLPSDITLFILMVVSLGGIFLVLRGKKPTHKS